MADAMRVKSPFSHPWLMASGGVERRWSPDGTELFYFSGQTLMAVPVRVRPTFSAGTPTALFDAPVLPNYTSDSHSWQLAPDGPSMKRPLLVKLHSLGVTCRRPRCDSHGAVGRSRAAFYSRFLVIGLAITAQHVIRIGGVAPSQ